MKQRTIAVDFDGVIHQYRQGYNDGSIYDDPVDGARATLKRLVKEGYQIVIFTTRLNPMFDEKNKSEGRNPRRDIEEWLDTNGFVKDKHFHDLTAFKPAAIIYIDDRALRFTNWSDVRKLFV